MIHYSHTARGRTVKAVTCEECGHPYFYLAERAATGDSEGFLLFSDPDGMGAPEAAREARAALKKELAGAVEVVPCPRCGRVQAAMVEEARRRHLAWVRGLALLLFALGFLALAVGFVATLAAAVENRPDPAETATQVGRVAWGSAAGLIAASFGLGYLKLRLNRRFDPNAEDQAVRIKAGKAGAVTREQVEAMVAYQRQPPAPGA